LFKIQDSVGRITAYNWLIVVFLTSLGVTASIWGIRELKWLEKLELGTYDLMLRSRPVEPADGRILLVTITEEDLKQQKWPLSDQTINTLLAKLKFHQPRVIGLNIYRPEQKNLGVNLLTKDNIFTTCLLSNIGRSEITPPTNFPIENVGFNDMLADHEIDQVLRRSLLFAEVTNTDNKCITQFSFASLLAINYLEKQGIKYHFNENQELQIGQTIFPRLDKNSGGYENTDANGYQILLNYRNFNYLAQQVTLTQVLNDEVNPNWVKDKLVIIGTTAYSLHPGYYTPYNSLPDQPPRIAGMFIHAQIASQIISTVLDERSLIYYWTDPIEFLWIWLWSLIGAILARQWRYLLMLMVMTSFILIGLVGIAAGLYLQGIWIPLIPPMMGVIMSSIVIVVYTNQKNQGLVKQLEEQKEVMAELKLLLNETTLLQSFYDHQMNKNKLSILRTGGLLLGSRYQIVQTLGAGGFGRTYLAQDHHRPGEPICVVKQLMPARQDKKFLQVARRLFHTEAEILGTLGKHPYIPELLAYFEDNQEFYLVQEYIPGHTLSEELSPEQSCKSEEFVITMLREILEILVFVHHHHVIHRDIKPTNIIRCNHNNKLVLIDFGAVKFLQPSINDSTAAVTIAIGTKGYAPPEQFAGHPRLCSDIYALGMMGIQAITGVSPQEIKINPYTGNFVWQDQVKIDQKLATILEKMVCYHFSDRYQSATAVLQDLNYLK
jgi:CHASE2 domain-containing sensor protein/predicted Ser/Thr protein kinase